MDKEGRADIASHNIYNSGRGCTMYNAANGQVKRYEGAKKTLFWVLFTTIVSKISTILFKIDQ